MKKRNNYLLISILIVLIIQVGMYFTIDSKNLLFVLNGIVLIGVILVVNRTPDTETFEKKGVNETDAQVIQKEVNKKLAKVSETLGFDIQQLLWLSKGNIQMFNKIVDSFHGIEANSQSNSASVEEITASINDFISNTERLNDNITMI